MSRQGKMQESSKNLDMQLILPKENEAMDDNALAFDLM